MSIRADTLITVTSPLAAAINSLSDPNIGLADSFRRLLVVSRRIGADDLTAVIRSELDGYDVAASVPHTRTAPNLKVSVRFDGYGGSYDTLRIGSRELPEHLAAVLNLPGFTQPVAELEALANNDEGKDPRLELPLGWVMDYRRQVELNAVPHPEMLTANAAYIVIPRTHLRGMLDRLRTSALELALDLETVSTEAGTPSGPTVQSEPELASVVNNFINVQAADNATVAIGDHNNVAAGQGATAVQLSVGDVSGLLSAAEGILGSDGVRALQEALDEDGGEPAARTNSFLDRVREGGYVLAGGITTNGAYDGLMALLHQVFPGF